MANKKLRINSLCHEKGIRKAELAQRLGISPATLSQALWRNNFSIERLAEIADVFGVEIPDLFESKHTYRCPKCGEEFEIKINKK